MADRDKTETIDSSSGAVPADATSGIFDQSGVWNNRLRDIEQFLSGADKGDRPLENLSEWDTYLVHAREYSLATALAYQPDLVYERDKLLATVLNRVWRITMTEAAAVFAWPDDGRRARLEQTYRGATIPTGATVELPEDLVAALRAGRTVNFPANTLGLRLIDNAKTRRGVPLNLGERSWGFLLLEDLTSKTLAPMEEKFLESLARESAAVLFAMDAWERTRREFERIFSDLSACLEERKGLPPGRGQDLARLFRLAAPAAGLEPHEIEAGALAAHLIDLGELAVSEMILNKPAELTAPERKFLMVHTLLSVRLLRRFLLIKEIDRILLCHHERWDGAGYPGGLAGKDIPATARLLAVCDSFEELVSTRPYHQPMDFFKAYMHLQGQAGYKFDPLMVKAVLKVAHDWYQGRKRK